MKINHKLYISSLLINIMIKRSFSKASCKLGGWSFWKVLFLIIVILVSLGFVESVDAIPLIDFVDPTPSDGTDTTNTSIEINVSITESDLGEMKFNWKGVNYSFYKDSLVLMMNFDNVSALDENDTHVVDLSKYGNNGTINGNPIMNLTGGKYGGAFEFDGSGDEVTISDSSEFSPYGDGSSDGELSICVWVYVNALPSTDAAFVDKGDPDYEYGLGIDSGTGKINAYTWNSAGSIYYRIDNAGNAMNDNRWHYVCSVLNYKADGTGDLSVYQDGVNVLIDTTNATVNMSDGTAGLSIGGKFGGSTDYFNGTIDEVRVWNSLSANEVKQQYYGNLHKYDLVNFSQNLEI